MEYDLIIIGMGISGISASIYAKNSGLKVLLLEKNSPGGLLNRINKVNNYPGYSEITGPDLALELFQSINNLQIPYKIAEVQEIKVEGNKKMIKTTVGNFESKFVIIASGRQNRKLGLVNEEKLMGHGISTCALCDGNLYKDKEIAVVGGGNSALEETIYLSKIVKKIYLIHHRDAFRAEEALLQQLKEKKNVEIFLNSQITSLIEDKNELKEIVINDKKHLSVSALFTYIGFEPNNSFFINLNILNKEGYIEVNENYETKIKGIYATGDCIKKEVYQLITSAYDGVMASIHIINQLKNKN